MTTSRSRDPAVTVSCLLGKFHDGRTGPGVELDLSGDVEHQLIERHAAALRDALQVEPALPTAPLRLVEPLEATVGGQEPRRKGYSSRSPSTVQNGVIDRGSECAVRRDRVSRSPTAGCGASASPATSTIDVPTAASAGSMPMSAPHAGQTLHVSSTTAPQSRTNGSHGPTSEPLSRQYGWPRDETAFGIAAPADGLEFRHHCRRLPPAPGVVPSLPPARRSRRGSDVQRSVRRAGTLTGDGHSKSTKGQSVHLLVVHPRGRGSRGHQHPGSDARHCGPDGGGSDGGRASHRAGGARPAVCT